MSKETKEKFLEKLDENPDLKDKFLAEIKKTGSPDGAIAFGRAAGFVLSKEDIDELRQEFPENSELSDDDLSKASGGVSVRKFPTHWA